MTIESTVFQRRRFVLERLERAGFERGGKGYELVRDFMDGEFQAILTVDAEGVLTGRVIDVMNEEEYEQLRNESFNGTYVNTVRAAYEDLLESIASQCCKDVLFSSEQANRITDLIAERFGTRPDFPFEQSQYKSYGVFRHGEEGKWFALIMGIKWDMLLKNGNTASVDVINLKIDPATGDELRSIPGIFPAYHMNRKHWITVVLDDTLADEEVARLIETSFELTS